MTQRWVRLVLVLALVAAACYLPELLSPRPPAKEPLPERCFVNIYWVRIDPITKARVDSTWAGTVEVPCSKK